MDVNLFIAALQLAIAAYQLKLDYFTRTANRNNSDQLNNFYRLGEAMRSMEFALSETVAFIRQTDEREPNERLATLWQNAYVLFRNVEHTAQYAQLAFEKNLYWRNPDFYNNQDSKQLYYISLENVLNQLRKLRLKYEKIQRKISD